MKHIDLIVFSLCILCSAILIFKMVYPTKVIDIPVETQDEEIDEVLKEKITEAVPFTLKDFSLEISGEKVVVLANITKSELENYLNKNDDYKAFTQLALVFFPESLEFCWSFNLDFVEKHIENSDIKINGQAFNYFNDELSQQINAKLDTFFAKKS